MISEKIFDSALNNKADDSKKKIDSILINIENNNNKLINLLNVTFKDAIWLKPFLNDSHHGLKHGDQVRLACLKILQNLNTAEKEELIIEGSGISKEDPDKYARVAIEIAALFHDCGRFNEKGEVIFNEQKNHHIVSLKRAELFCEDMDLNIINPYLRDAIISHDFQSKELTPDLEPPKTLIGKIVQSADQLGWFHPDSINRTLDYNKALGVSFYNPNLTLMERLSWKPGIQPKDALTVMLSQLFGPVDSNRFGVEFARNKVNTYKLDLEKGIMKIAEEYNFKNEVKKILDGYKIYLSKDQKI